MNSSPAEPALARTMGFPHATAMVVGTILGVSVFVQPAEISRLVPSGFGMMAVWLLAGILTLCGALVCAEYAATFPQTGGVYVFLRENFSPAVAFLWGWAMFWSVHSGIIAAMSVIFARYVGYFATLSDTGTRIVAVAGIWVLSAINYAGIRPGSIVQLVLTSAKLVAIVLLLLVLFALGGQAPHLAAPLPAAGAIRVSGRGFALALVAALFSFGGWHMVTYTSGETRDPGRTIPRALLVGTLAVAACYLLLNAAYLYVLPFENIMRSTRVAADAMEVLLGPAGGAAVSALVVLSSFGAMNGIILAGPRVYLAMAREGLAFRSLGAVHAHFHSPHVGLLAQAAWASVLVATNTYRQLFTRVVYTEWIFFAILAAGVFHLRRRADHAAPRTIWGRWVVPVLFILSSLVIVVNQIAESPAASAWGLLLVALGLPVFIFWSRKASRRGAAHARD